MLPYDDSNPKDIERYAKKLIGKTFQQVLEDSKFLEDAITDSKIDYSNPNQKGNLGNLLEEKYFCYKANSDQEADFAKCGVELKATCYDILKNGNISAGERLVLTMISFEEPVEHDFYKSHVWEKCRKILLIYYERNKLLQYNTLYKIGYVSLVTPDKKDLIIIMDDYNKIIAKIEKGLAHELSESDTMYLGACTKGSTSAKSLRPQFYNQTMLAPKRAFCFKRQYMDYILHHFIIPNHENAMLEKEESIVSNVDELVEDNSFEHLVYTKLEKYRGIEDKDICYMFDREYNNNKAQWTDLTYRMLGIKGNRAEEFEKANIVVKVVRIESNNNIRENVSFPPFKFMDFVNEKWEDSELYTYFSETRFFFVFFKKEKNETCYRLYKWKFWNMPYNDLNVEVKQGWENIQQCIKNGVVFTKKENKDGFTIVNNLPKKADNRIIHIRPYAGQRAYFIKNFDGREFTCGDVKKDANMLPQGDYMTTQSFWINDSYVLDEILPDNE